MEPSEDPRRRALLHHISGWAPAAVVSAMAVVDRTAFVPEAHRHLAWIDDALPTANGQTISQPSLVARMVSLVSPAASERVLDVGTGSGYHAAILAQLAGRVWSIERDPMLAATAAATLGAAGVAGVDVLVGDGTRGWPAAEPFDVINVAAAVEDDRIPDALLDQLAQGGRLIAPLGRGRQRLVRLVRAGDRFRRSDHGPVSFVPLVPGEL